MVEKDRKDAEKGRDQERTDDDRRIPQSSRAPSSRRSRINDFDVFAPSRHDFNI